MRVLQVMGWLLLLFMGMFGVYEIVQHFRHGGWALTDVGQFWNRLHSPSLSFMQAFMQNNISADLWNWFVRQPVLLVSGVFAAICLFIPYTATRTTSAR